MNLFWKDLNQIAIDQQNNPKATNDLQKDILALINQKITAEWWQEITIENQQNTEAHIWLIAGVSNTIMRVKSSVADIEDNTRREENFDQYLVSGTNILLSTYESFEKIPLIVMMMIIEEFTFSFERAKKED